MTTTLSTTRTGVSSLVLAHGAMLLFAVLIAASFSLGDLAVPYLAPGPLNTLRFAIATLVMGGMAFGVARQPLRAPIDPWRFPILGVLFATYFVTMFIALELTAPISTSAIFTLIPLMTALFAFFLVGQKTGPLGLVSLVIAGLGSVWVIFRGELAAVASVDIGLGERIFLIGCVAYAIYTPLIKKFSRGEHGFVFSFWMILASTIWFALYSGADLVRVDWLHLPGIVWVAAVYLAVGPTAGAVFLTQYASRHLPAAKVIAYGYLTPVVVILLEGLAGHGWATAPVLLGALVTVLGLVVLAFAPDRTRSREP